MVRSTGDVTAEEVAAVWLVQARRLLARMDWAPDSASVESTRTGTLARIETPIGHNPRTATAIDEWAAEAAARVSRGDPQPSDAEVYKAARAMLS